MVWQKVKVLQTEILTKNIIHYEVSQTMIGFILQSDRMRDSVLARSTTTGLLMRWPMEDHDPKA